MIFFHSSDFVNSKKQKNFFELKSNEEILAGKSFNEFELSTLVNSDISISSLSSSTASHTSFEFVCHLCGEKFDKKERLKNHTLDHLNHWGLTDQCINSPKSVFNIIDKPLNNTISQKIAYNSKFNCNNAFQCSNCTKSFSSLSALQGDFLL